jgi:TetR/AcrR family transcriptional repressor of nem operon
MLAMSRVQAKYFTREKLLDQGVSMLMEQGYHGTGLQDLLQAVGVPKGSFYNYFASKEEFGAEVIHHYIEPFIQLLEHYLNRADLTAVQALGGYFQELIQELNRRGFKGGCLLGNLMGEIGDTSDACRESLKLAVHRYRDKLAQGIARAQREGDFRTDKTAAELADFLADAWQGALLRMKVEQSTQPLESCCRNLLEDWFRR